MVFKASNKRERRAPRPAGEGTQLIASVPIREWYRRELKNVTTEMLKDYKSHLNMTLEHGQVERYFAQDASASSILQETMRTLNKKWINIFKNYAKIAAQNFVDKVDQHSKTTTTFSLSTAGLEQPRMEYNTSIQNTLQSSIDYNDTLIVGIQKDVHEKIYSAVMVSLTSPDPMQQGTSGIENALKDATGFSDKRIELIARDQNSKVYASLNTERMRQNGVDQFRWIHSSAGKVPRHTHVEKDGEIFDIDDARLWEGPKNDQGPPGWAINCRCRAVPII